MAASNMEAFDAYFRRADLDKDGRISGDEAVAFFQGSRLPQHVLAQVWMHADQNRTGFLGRPEFYNALKLVTVAQSGRELTPDIVKAALYGPAAAKIPAPQINPVSSSTPQMNSMATTISQSSSLVPPSTQMGIMGQSAAQNPGIRGPQALPGVGMNQQISPSADNHFMRPSQTNPTLASVPTQGISQGLTGGGSIAGPRLPGSNAPSLATDWFGNRATGASVGAALQVPIRGSTPQVNQNGLGPALSGAGVGATSKSQVSALPAFSFPSKPVDSALPTIQPPAKDSKALVVSGNGFSSDPVFGGDVFSATPLTKQDTSVPPFTASSVPNSSGSASVAVTSQNSHRPGELDLPGKPPLPPGAGHLQQAQLLVKQNQLHKVQSPSASTVSKVSVGPVNSDANQSQLPWPKITQSDIQKYTGVFVKVDRDKDGKITGEEARNLFLSWRLPREVLKQVWDLSDQDSDSMLTLREFCTALYLMERYREGRPLPAALPNSIRYDETLLVATSQQHAAAYGGSAWQPSPGLSQQGIPGSHPVMPATGVKPLLQAPIPSQTDGTELPVQQKSKVPALEKHLVDQLSKEEQSALNSKFQEAADADKRVQELEKEILESKEKTEFYRNKMQELVLYKSRCDSRLNEITERASADRREVELLAKRYEEKCRQIGGDLASKLTLEEATFRDIQGRKLELYNAIVKMEQGGSSNGALKDRADRIQSDLEELVKSLNERCKQYGLRAKPTSLIELPFGWQPGIQEGTADWTEDWDKFDDEGFTIVKELTAEVENVVAASQPKTPAVQSDETSRDEVSPVASTSNVDKSEKPSSNDEHIPAIESVNAHSDDESARSPPGSPQRSAAAISSHDLNSSQFEMHDSSPRDKDTNSEYGGAESTISGDKFADEPSWGATFDASDDVDSIWGFSAINTKQENDYEKRRQSSIFDSGDFGLNPIRIDSPSAASTFGKEKGPFFDSVPSTPLFSSGSSPKFNEGPGDHYFNSFSRFDSFNMPDSGFLPQHESLSRFDSFRSTADHGRAEGFGRFDSIRSTADHGRVEGFARFDSIRSTSDHGQAESLARFDSFRSTSDYSRGESFVRFDSIRSTADNTRGFPSFDDADPFGSTGPFKSTESHTPRQGTDHWSAF